MPGRPEGSKDQVSREKVQATVYQVEALNSLAYEEMLKKIDGETLNDQQKEMVDKLCESIICAHEKELWQEVMISCVNDFTEIEKLGVMGGVLEVSESHKLELYPSAILYHSNEK